MRSLSDINFNYYIVFFILIFSLESISKSNEEIYKDLSSTKKFGFEALIENNSVSILFQPNCSSCKKQISKLRCLPKNTKITLVGSLGTEDQIKQTYLKLKAQIKQNHPGFYVQTEDLNIIGFNSNLAPQTIIYKDNKSVKFLGFKKCKFIKEALEKNI